MTPITDALAALRDHREAPRTLGEVADLADRLLAAAGLAPPRSTTERTVRFYVSRGVVRPPVGRGASARWEYGHLLDLLAVRIAQHEGIALEAHAAACAERSDADVEAMVAARLGAVTPAPVPAAPPPAELPGEAWRRVALGPDAELHLAADHPLWHDPARREAALAAVRRALSPSDPEC